MDSSDLRIETFLHTPRKEIWEEPFSAPDRFAASRYGKEQRTPEHFWEGSPQVRRGDSSVTFEDERNPPVEARSPYGAKFIFRRDRSIIDDVDRGHNDFALFRSDLSRGRGRPPRDIASHRHSHSFSATPQLPLQRHRSASLPRRRSQAAADAEEEALIHSRRNELLARCGRPDEYNGDYDSLRLFEVVGMNKELKAEIDEKNSVIAQLRHELHSLKCKPKHDWESAYRRLEEENDAAKTTLEKELSALMISKAEMESQMGYLKADVIKGNELADELEHCRKENDEMKGYLASLDGKFEKSRRELEQLNRKYQDALSDKAQFEADASQFKEGFTEVMQENEKLRDGYKIYDEKMNTMQEELERMMAAYDRAKEEKLECEQTLSHAIEEKDEALAKCIDLHNSVYHFECKQDAESRYMEVFAKQQDTMNAILEENQQEIDELRQANKTLKSQKGDLKQELILVLETLSHYQ